MLQEDIDVNLDNLEPESFLTCQKILKSCTSFISGNADPTKDTDSFFKSLQTEYPDLKNIHICTLIKQIGIKLFIFFSEFYENVYIINR